MGPSWARKLEELKYHRKRRAGAGDATAFSNAESDLIAAFLAFVVQFPRSFYTLNTAQYALQVISTVRSYYDDLCGRRVGLNAAGRCSGRPKAVACGLRRIAPCTRRVQRPILQMHLRPYVGHFT